ncbi:MAG: HAMP domain-containing sensor histidine kinase [Candidatus Kapabacteria bacterium]|nr:HAMP domain-containing sensor histidine kinase [Candidatus Kapabacteria bacterium]
MKFFVNPIYFDSLNEREYKSNYELQYNEWLNSEYGVNKTNYKTKLDRDTNLAKGAYTYGLIISAMNPIKAKRWMDSVVVYSQRANYKRGKISALNGYGFIYANLGDIVSSNYYFKKAIEFGESEKNNPKSNIIDKLGWTYIYYGNMLINIGDSAKAFKQYDKSREIFYSVRKDPEGVGYALLKKSIQFTNNSDFIKANLYLDSAYQVFEYEVPKDLDFRNRHERGIAEVYLFKSGILKRNKEYQKAIELLDSSIHLIKLYHVRNIIIQAMLEKASIEIIMNNTKNTLKDIDYCIDLAIEAKMKKELASSYKTKSEYFKSIGNHSEAYDYLMAYMKLKESILNDDKIKSIAKTESDVENELKILSANNEKNKKEAQLQKEQNQKIILVFIVVFVVLLLLGSIYIVLRLRKLNQDLKSSEEKIFELNMKQSKYYAVISHDIRSPLNTITYTLDKINNDDNISDIEKKNIINELSISTESLKEEVEKLFQIAKENTTKSEISNVNIENEIYKVINLYQNIITTKGLIIKLNLEENEITVDRIYLDTILRNIINNAVKYSPINSEIHINSIKNEISLSNKIDSEALLNQKGHGFGMKTCMELAKEHNHEITISEDNGMYEVSLRIG